MRVAKTIALIGLTLLPFGASAQITSTTGSYDKNQPTPTLDRWKWFAESTLGAESLTGGVVSAGFGTLTDQPHEYGPHYIGFAERYGMRLTGVATGNAIEASLGVLLKEDPRYPRSGPTVKLSGRVKQVVKMTFYAPDFSGHTKPAYARFVATAGNNFISNSWRADSEADVSHALIRTGTGILGRMASNAFDEFWPDVERHLPLMHRKPSSGQ